MWKSAAVSPTVVASTLMMQKNSVTSGTLLLIVPIWLRATVFVVAVDMFPLAFRLVNGTDTKSRVNADGSDVQRSVKPASGSLKVSGRPELGAVAVFAARAAVPLGCAW